MMEKIRSPVTEQEELKHQDEYTLIELIALAGFCCKEVSSKKTPKATPLL